MTAIAGRPDHKQPVTEVHMAIENHSNFPTASFGVEVDNAGRVSITAMGEIDARIAEQVA